MGTTRPHLEVFLVIVERVKSVLCWNWKPFPRVNHIGSVPALISNLRAICVFIMLILVYSAWPPHYSTAG